MSKNQIGCLIRLRPKNMRVQRPMDFRLGFVESFFLPIGGRGATGRAWRRLSLVITPLNGGPRALPHTLTGLLAAHNFSVLEKKCTKMA